MKILQGRGLFQEKRPGLLLPEEEAQHGQEMGFPRAEMALKKYPPPFRPRERSEDRLQAAFHLPGDHERIQDHPPEMSILKILQLDDSLNLRNLD
jgi:hypothetical protein